MSSRETTVIEADEAETRFAELLDRASLGEEFTITRDGAAVARLVPAQAAPTPESCRQIIATMRRMSEGKRLEGVTISELIAEGRR